MRLKYIIENERDRQWGLTVTTAGYERIEAGGRYPSDSHLDSYCFSPEKGRTLDEYQMVYVTEGQGVFRSESMGEVSVAPGTIFLLFPGEWHTYRPDPSTGWTHYWIGFKGVNMDSRVANGFLRKEEPIFHVGLDDEIVRLYLKAIDVADREMANFQQMLAGIANYLLGLIYTLDRNNRLAQDRHVVGQIDRARMIMHDNIESRLSIQDVADRTGVGYSSFRKNFKKYTGLSPAAYFQDLKLQRAKDLLRTTDLPIKEIAYRLNFESADYFSTLFRRKTGMPPSAFRD